LEEQTPPESCGKGIRCVSPRSIVRRASMNLRAATTQPTHPTVDALHNSLVPNHPLCYLSPILEKEHGRFSNVRSIPWLTARKSNPGNAAPTNPPKLSKLSPSTAILVSIAI